MRALALSIALLLTAACARTPPPRPEAPTGTRLTWLGHAAFLVQSPGGTNLLIDPWLENPKAPQGFRLPQRIDAVLVSHGHRDHVGQAQQLAAQHGARIVASNELAILLGSQQPGGNAGGRFEFGDVTVHLVPAVHSSSYAIEVGPAVYAGAPLGFVVQVRDGPTLYHAGDTGLFSDMQLIGSRHRPTVALLPIGGNFTMGPEDAAVAVGMLGVQTVIPMHYGTFPVLTGTPDALRAAMEEEGVEAEMQVLQPGRAVDL